MVDDAPEGALLMTEGSFAQLRFDRPAPMAVALEGACRLLDPAETPCALEVRLDDEQVSCAARDVPEGLGGIRCTLEIPAGRHRLEVRPPPESQVYPVLIAPRIPHHFRTANSSEVAVAKALTAGPRPLTALRFIPDADTVAAELLRVEFLRGTQ